MTGPFVGARRLLAGAMALAVGVGVADDAAAGGLRRARAIVREGNATATARPQRPAGPPTSGTVLFVTEKRAYLDRGSREGLQARQSLSMFRGSRAVGSCTVETLADHQATCTGGRLRAGDSFRLAPRNGARKREPPPPELPPLTDQETLRTRAAVVAEAPVEKVDFSGAKTLVAHTHASLAPGIVVWQTEPDPRGAYTLEEIDGAIQIYDLGSTGMRFDAAFSAMHWGARDALGRFRPTMPTQFYLWGAEVSRRRADANTVFAVGRIWPWHTPGLTLLDGFQVGRHNDAETAEGGVYAGLVPWALNVAPSTATWASGVYGSLAQIGSSKTTFRLAREEARVGIWHGLGVGMVTEGEVLAQTWLGDWNLGGGAHARLAPSVSSQPVLDRAYLDLGARATLAVGAGLHVRYFGSLLPDDATLVGETMALRGSTHVLADAHWDLSRWLGFGGFAGVNQDRDSGRAESYVTAELRLPRFLGDAGGLSTGAEIEEGWLRGRLAYGQLVMRFASRLQLLARVSGSTSEFRTPTPAPNVDEIGGYVNVDGTLTSWLRLRAWSLIRVPFLIQGALPVNPSYGLIVGSSLAGSF